MVIHPQVIEKEGKKQFVILPYEEFLQIQEALEDFEDIKELRREKEDSKDLPTIPLDKVVRDIDL